MNTILEAHQSQNKQYFEFNASRFKVRVVFYLNKVGSAVQGSYLTASALDWIGGKLLLFCEERHFLVLDYIIQTLDVYVGMNH